MMILSEDALMYMKKVCMINCIKTILIGASLYAIIMKISEQENKINNLTKKVEELSSKGE